MSVLQLDTLFLLSSIYHIQWYHFILAVPDCDLNPFNAELNRICHPLALLGAHNFSHVSGLRVNVLYPLKREDQQDATIRCLLLTSISTCFGQHYVHLQENKGPVTAFGVLFWFCWMWSVAVVGRCLAGCDPIINFCLNMFRASLCPKHVETEVDNKHLIVASCWSSLFIVILSTTVP